MKLKSISDKTFKEFEVEVDDLQYDLANKVKELVKSEFPIIVNEEGELFIGVFVRIGNENKGQDFAKYQIKISKLSNNGNEY